MSIYKVEDKKKDGKQKYNIKVNYTDFNGNYKQIMKTAYGLTEAKELEKQILSDINMGKIGGKSITVQQLYDEYINYKKHEVRETSLQKSKSVLNHDVLPTFKNIRVDKLTKPMLTSWKSEIGDRTNISLTTKKNIYKEFHTLLNYAVKVEYIPTNPLTKVGTFKDVYFVPQEEKIHYYTQEEFIKYISCAMSHTSTINDYAYTTFFMIAFYTGMRKGEINALKWTDIDKDNVIHVKRSVAQKVKGKSIVETPPKNKSSIRTLQMPQPLIDYLSEHKLRQQQYKGFDEDWRVCGGKNCLKDSSLTNKNFQFANESNLPHIRIHDFRHTHATLLINEGINISEIARRLGHSDIKMTLNTYGHLYPREEERAINILNNIKVK